MGRVKILLFSMIGIGMVLLCSGILLIYHNQALLSPVLGIPKVRFADNIWFPKPIEASDEKIAEEITATAAFFVEGKSGDVLFEKNAREKLPIASLTKIMTAIVTLENKSYEDEIYISQRAAEMEPDKMLLKAGETLSVKELLQGVFLVSANDASEALAESSTGRREEFLALMNSKATQLGMNDTFFINPTGLMEDGKKQYSTAFDVALMSRYLIQRHPEILEISSNPHIYIPETEKHQDYDLYTGINLLTTYPGVVGLKTGYTPEAGLTLVTVAKKDGKEVIGVLLNSESRRDDAKLLLDYSFKKLGV